VYVVLLAVFNTLLHRNSGQSDLRVGTPVASRQREELQQLVGLLLNTQVIKADITPGMNFTELVAHLHQRVMEAQQYQDVPFEQIVDALGVSRDTAVTPVFQTLFSVQPIAQDAFALGDLTIELLPIDTKTAKFDLSVHCFEWENGPIDAIFEYATDVFVAATVERMAGHFQQILQQILVDIPPLLSAIDLLTEEEKQQFAQWQGPELLYDEGLTLHRMLRLQAGRTPEAIAVSDGWQPLTYRELPVEPHAVVHSGHTHFWIGEIHPVGFY